MGSPGLSNYQCAKILIHDSQVNEYGAKFRLKRRRFCIMHNFEWIIEHSLKTFLRIQGLDHDAEESQNAYRIHCYMDRCLKTRCSVILNSNVAMLRNTPEIMFKFQKN